MSENGASPFDELPYGIDQIYGDRRFRLDADLLAMAYLEDRTVATVEEGGILRRWSLPSGRQIHAFDVSELENCWAFGPDGATLVSGSDHLSLWHVDSGELIGSLDETSWVLSLAFSPDGSLLASGHEDYAIRIWDAHSGRLLHTVTCHDAEVCALAFSPDGTHLATAGEERIVFLLEVASGKVVGKLVGHTDRVDALAWHPSGTKLASAAWDTSVRLWDVARRDLLALLNGQGQCVHTVSFLPTAPELLVCGDSDFVVRVWNHEKLKVVSEYRRHHGPVRLLTVRGDGKQVISGGEDRMIRVFDLDHATTPPIGEEPLPTSAVVSVCVDAQGNVGALHEECAVQFWSATGTTLPSPLELAEPPTALAHRGQTWAIGLADGQVAAWRASAAGNGLAVPQELPWANFHGHAIRLLDVSADERWLATSAGMDGVVLIQEALTGEPVLLIPESVGGGPVEALSFHPRLPIVATAGIDWQATSPGDGRIMLWHVDERRIVRQIDTAATRLAFRPDGERLAGLTLYRSILLWEPLTGKLCREISLSEATIESLCFHPDGVILATGSSDKCVRLWNAEEGRLLATYDLETVVRDLAFTADGTALVTGNGNSTCYRLLVNGKE